MNHITIEDIVGDALVVHDIDGSALNGSVDSLDVTNSLLFDFVGSGFKNNSSSADAVSFTNNTIDGGQFGLNLQSVVDATLTNNIITGASDTGVRVARSSAVVTSRYNDIFDPGAANGDVHNTADAGWTLTDTTGDISADPLYADPANGVFELSQDSPAIDAAWEPDAPLTDLYSRPRFDDRTVPNTGGGFITYVDIGALERFHSGSGVNLVATDVGAELLGDGTIRFDVTIANVGSQDSSELGVDWTNRFLLSYDGLRNSIDVPVGEALQGVQVPAGDEVSFSATFPVPVAFPHDYQPMVIVDVFDELYETLPTGELNNELVAEQFIPFDLPDLEAGVPVVGDWFTDGTDMAFGFQVPPGSNLRLELTSDQPACSYVGLNYLPDEFYFDDYACDGEPIVIPNAGNLPLDGTLRLIADPLPSGPSPFTLQVDELGGLLTGVNLTEGGNAGPVTLLLEGGPFEPDFELRGPDGAGQQNYLPQVKTFQYTIYFENDPDVANAAAQVVTITDQLDPNLDWSTFELKEVTFGDHTVLLEGTPTHGWTRVYAEVLGVVVEVEAELDVDTGLVTWVIRTLDPVTLGPTLDPLAGFLPPNHNKPEGEGHVVFTIEPLDAATTNTVIANDATIVFGVNPPIVTNEHSITLDLVGPESQVDALPATVRTASFAVGWTGDDAGGSGIGTYTIYVSQDSGPWEIWLEDTPETSAEFAGIDGHSYAFRSNEGAIASRADCAVQVAAYFGDATGNHTYSGLDAAYIARVAVGLDSGFAAYSLTSLFLKIHL
ncbi:MAG: hypothetical protein ABIL62_01600 [Planctomycetota bacterium]